MFKTKIEPRDVITLFILTTAFIDGPADLYAEYYQLKYGINLHLNEPIVVDHIEYLKKHPKDLYDLGLGDDWVEEEIVDALNNLAKCIDTNSTQWCI